MTTEWWKTTKKPFKGRPKTKIGAKIKAWESALAAVRSDNTLVKLNKANKALKALGLTLQSAITEFEKKTHLGKFNELAKSVTSLKNGVSIKKAHEELQEIEDEIELQSRVEKAANRIEAGYEAAWLLFERLGRDPIGVANFEAKTMRLEQLNKIAVKLRDSDDEGMKRKYLRQVGILASIERDFKRDESAYRARATECIMVRRDLLKEFARCQKGLTWALSEIAKVNTRAISSELKEAKIKGLVKSSEGGYKKTNDQFAPGTKLRSSTDTKAMKMSMEDMKEWIVPVSSDLFKANKALNTTMKKIRAAAQ